VWRGIEGEDRKVREQRVRRIIEKVLDRRVGVRGVEERLGEGDMRILLILSEGEDKEEILDRKEEI